MYNTRTLYIPEILEEVEKASGPKEKKAILIANRSPALGTILAYTHDMSFEMILSKEDVDAALQQPYKKERGELGTCPTHLFKEYRRLHLFVKGSGSAKDLPKQKVINLLIQLRECLHVSEFEVVVKMLKREQLAKGLTVNLLKETFPQLLKA